MSPLRWRSGYKYQLDDDFWIWIPFLAGRFPEPLTVDRFIRLDPDGTLHLLAGYAWDGASGPTKDTASFMRGPLAHDGLYQLCRAGILDAETDRDDADALMLEIIEHDIALRWPGWQWSWVRGPALIRARAWWRSVDLFAGFAADPRSRKVVHEFPVPIV